MAASTRLRHRFRPALPALCLILALASSCALPSLTTPPKLYLLTPKTTYSDQLPWITSQLLVEPPAAAAGLDSARIALSRSPTTLDYFAGVSWIDRAPTMIQTLMVESFERSQKIVSVGRDVVGLRADFLLKTELREFQADYAGPPETTAPTIRVQINAKLVSLPRRSIDANETFDAPVQASSPAFDDVIAAWDEALGKAMRRLVEWTLIEADRLERQRDGQRDADS
jgi:cholesterol transport system auxiliary component